MAIAAQRSGDDRRVVAVIGDGAMSAGMAFEALNNAGIAGADLLVILNDNEMSISEPVGALNGYLAKLLSSRLYNSVRRGGKEVLSKLPPVKELAKRWEEHMKGMVLPGTLFEEFGFNYIGPIDGHDVDTLARTLANVKELKGPQLLHVITKKGYGYARAEEDPILYHGVAKFDPAVGYAPKPRAKPAYTQIFGDWLCDIAAADPRVVAITPAMREGSGLVRFSQEYPERYFDVGIAEQHAVTFAAGLACEGMKPVVAIYSTFLQRAYDQLIHDVALQNLPVVFAIDRAGIVGADGATHCGAYDLTYLRCVPNMTVMAPSDENECRQMLYTAYTLDTPSAVRYPRGTGPGVAIASPMTALPIGKGEVRRTTSRRTNRIAIMAFGSMLGAGARRRRGARRDGRQHALREAARHRARVQARARARCAGHDRGERRRRRRRQRGRRSARRRRHRRFAAAARIARRVRRSRRSVEASRRMRARRARHRRRRSTRDSGSAAPIRSPSRRPDARLARRPIARRRPADKIAARQLEFPCVRSRSSASPPPKGRRISPSGSTRTASRGSSSRSMPAPRCRAIRARSPASA